MANAIVWDGVLAKATQFFEARAVLLHRAADARVQRFFLAQKHPRASHIDQMIDSLAKAKPNEMVDVEQLGGARRISAVRHEVSSAYASIPSPRPHCMHCDNCEERRHWIRRG